MQPNRLNGEWTVSIEVLNLDESSGPIPFDIGMFSSLSLYSTYNSRRFLLATWHGCMEDLLDILVQFSDNPEHPNMVVEVRYENQLEKLAGSLKASKGRYVTAMELRVSEHSDAYMELFKYLDPDAIKSWMPKTEFEQGVQNVININMTVAAGVPQQLPAEYMHNATMLEAALEMAEATCQHTPGKPLTPDFVRAYQNVVDRVNRILAALLLPLTSLKATIVIGYVFPTVGRRVISAMRDARMRTLNQPIGPLPIQPPSEFSDSFPL